MSNTIFMKKPNPNRLITFLLTIFRLFIRSVVQIQYNYCLNCAKQLTTISIKNGQLIKNPN